MFRLAETIRRTQTTDGRILLDIHRGRMFCLNPLGSRVIELLEQGFDESAIVALISNSYSVSAATVRNDVCTFIEKLKKHEVLKTYEGPASISRGPDR